MCSRLAWLTPAAPIPFLASDEAALATGMPLLCVELG